MIDSNSKDEIPPEILLRLYFDFGVDETIGYHPRNHQSIEIENQKDTDNGAYNDDKNIVESPKEDKTHRSDKPLANSDNIKNLDDLKRSLENIDDFSLKTTSKNTVFSDGQPDSDLMVIGEAPGSDEDLKGLPFVGPSGQLLDQMLQSIGYTRSKNVYITNVIPWRPPGNRRPTPEEVNFCMPFLMQHIRIINPKVILLLGGLSANSLLNMNEGITKIRGKWFEVLLDDNIIKIPSIATFHPAYLLRSPHQKRLAWRDLLLLKKKMGSLKG